jgi:outer membrane protein assembly factor BamB
MKHSKFVLLGLAIVVTSAAVASAADWPCFRGPGQRGLSSDTGLPITWSANSNVAWKTELPGPGSSSPIVVGDRVFVTCYSGYATDRQDRKNAGALKNLKRHVLCLDRAGGKVLWTRAIPATGPEAPLQTYLNLHGYASSTPSSDGKRVYVFFGTSGVIAFDLDGKQLWQKSVGKDTHGWGSASSPVLYKDLVIVNASVESGALVALDRMTGAEAWRVKDMSETWSTPVLVPVPGGKTELVLSASRKLFGFDPEKGKELWHANSFDWYVCPTPVAHDGVVYALQNSTCVAVRAGGRGDVTKTHTLWQKGLGSVVSSAVYFNGYLYFAAGTALCLKAADGAEVYRERLRPDPGDIYAAPVAADGKIYYVSRQAGTHVVAAGPEFKLLAHNTLAPDTSVFNGSPAVSNSQLLLRSDRFVYCLGKGR